MTLVTLFEKLKNKIEIEKYDLQNDLRKGEGPWVTNWILRKSSEFLSEITYKDLAKNLRDEIQIRKIYSEWAKVYKVS